MNYQVYITTNLINNKYYIGVHKRDVFDDSYYGSGILIQRSLKKYGKNNFEQQVISSNLNRKQALYLEKLLVGDASVNDKNCYNLTSGGGYPPSHKGLKRSKETRKRMSKAQKGKIMPKEAILRMAETKRGSKQSKATINKRVKANRKPVVQLDLEGNYLAEYNSVKQAGKAVNGYPNAISEVLNGKNKTSYGFKWKYKNDL